MHGSLWTPPGFWQSSRLCPKICLVVIGLLALLIAPNIGAESMEGVEKLLIVRGLRLLRLVRALRRKSRGVDRRTCEPKHGSLESGGRRSDVYHNYDKMRGLVDVAVASDIASLND